MDKPSKDRITRRQVLGAGATLAATAFFTQLAQAQEPHVSIQPTSSPLIKGRRKLGSLEVSSLGMGIQNMSRTYPTTIPTRSEMLTIIRTAFDRGLTFYDAAEAYGPLEVERILGEGIEPFRRIFVGMKHDFHPTILPTT